MCPAVDILKATQRCTARMPIGVC